MVEVPHLDKRVWLLLIAAGVGLGIYLRRRSSSSAGTDSTVGDASTTDSIGSVDGSADPYSSGSVNALPGTQYGLPGPPGPPGPKGHRGKRGPRGKPPKKNQGNKHHTPAGKHQPRIAQQSHMANNTPMQSGVRVVQHRPGGVIQKGARKSNG